MHYLGSVEFDNLSFEKYTRHVFWSHCQTKLCNMLFMKELDRRLIGSDVTVNAVHPGVVRSEIRRNTPWWVKHFIEPLGYLFVAKTESEGAQTSVHLAVADELESGQYFVDCKRARYSSKCDDLELARKLWEVSEELVKRGNETC